MNNVCGYKGFVWSDPYNDLHDDDVEHAKRRGKRHNSMSMGSLTARMEAVRLEFVGAVALSSAAVAQFVQALRDVPQGAECEIDEIRCRRVKSDTESVVRLLCDPRVATFLCKRFACV
jgi:UDP-N-acetylglucosamine enolpyruvyl transferase